MMETAHYNHQNKGYDPPKEPAQKGILIFARFIPISAAYL